MTTTLHAYCVMGTHYHAVVEGSAEALSNTFHWLNSHYAREYNARHGRRGSLLSERFTSWAITTRSTSRRRSSTCWRTRCAPASVERPEDWPWEQSNRTLVRSRPRG